MPAMDRARLAKATAMVARRVVREPEDIAVAWDGATLVRSSEPTGWSVSAGPNAAGTYCRLNTPGEVPAATRVADLNVALMRFLDAELDAGIGEVTAAPDVRRCATG